MNRINDLKQYPSNPGTLATLDDLKQRATSGRASDVDLLMENLDLSCTQSRCKVIDFALSLVASAEGRARISHFLFNGSQIQRNYAALYFKRRGDLQLIDAAVQRGCIDEVQATPKGVNAVKLKSIYKSAEGQQAITTTHIMPFLGITC